MAEKKRGNRHCCYGECRSDERYPDRCEGVTFIPFPKPKTRLEDCKAWIKACGRPHEQLNPGIITKNYFVCSKHFVEGKPTDDFPYPVPYNGRPVQRGRKRRNQATADSNVPNKKVTCCTSQSEQPASYEPDVPAATSFTHVSLSGPSLDILAAVSEIRSLQDENKHLRNRVQYLEAELTQMKQAGAVTSTDSFTQTDASPPGLDMTEEITNSKIKNLFTSYTGLTFLASLLRCDRQHLDFTIASP